MMDRGGIYDLRSSNSGMKQAKNPDSGREQNQPKVFKRISATIAHHTLMISNRSNLSRDGSIPMKGGSE